VISSARVAAIAAASEGITLAQASAIPDERLEREFLGVGLVIVGLLVVAGLILSAQGLGGYLPEAVSSALRFLVGSGSYVVAVALVALGAVALSLKGQPLNLRAIAGLSLVYLCFLLARHVGVPRGEEFAPGALYSGGGIVGAALWWGALRVFGPICTWIVIAGALFVASMLLTQGRARSASVGIVRGAAAGGRWVWGRLPRPQLSRESGRELQALAASDTQPHAAPITPQVIELTIEPADRGPGLAPESEVGDDEPPEEPAPAPPPRKARAAKPAAGPKSPGGQLPLIGGAALYQPPPLSLLEQLPTDGEETKEERNQAEENIALLEDTLSSFGIQAKVRHYVRGPAVTRYEVEPVRGIRVSRIARLADDLALAFAAIDVRVEAPIPGKSLIGIEVPNSAVGVVGLRSILESETFRKSKSPLAVGIGKDIAGAPVVADLARMPHLLIAGATNTGKTV
jgi:S-DNA-T family DNA segregation ATPase FtsK/SpoIIIE